MYVDTSQKMKILGVEGYGIMMPNKIQSEDGIISIN